MKLIIVGAWYSPIYEMAFSQALESLDHEVISFKIFDYLDTDSFLGKVQTAIPIPTPRLLQVNNNLIKQVKYHQPDLVLTWRCTHLFPSTIQKINKLGILTVSYNNDDPFGPMIHRKAPWHHRLLWFWYLRSLKVYKRNFFYRQINTLEAKQYGANYAAVLMPYFRPWQDRPLTLTEAEKKQYDCDVVFAGHYEPDGREKSIRILVEAGIDVKIWGGKYWTSEVLGDAYNHFAPIVPVEGDNYTKALCGAKICLAFLSKLNRDTYTRRCFEIPACGRVMLAERTEDLQKMFKEDEEACFFSSNEELLEKVQWLLANPERREAIAKAGLRRVWTDGHDVKSRAQFFINSIQGASQ